ncbi:MAG TPA: glycoside hydrolase family 2 TIM barrel-domain containing protein [bacterium]|nr:glycoside hydrolase family 2 TIM barrel-domain containing protein [bacterium]
MKKYFAVTICFVLTAIFMVMNVQHARAAEAQPVRGPLDTRWAADVDREVPWQEYPRPQMVRAGWLNLNGQWEYEITKANPGKKLLRDDINVYLMKYNSVKKGDDGPMSGSILVPFSIESSISGVMRQVSEREYLWYRRSFEVPAEWKGRVLLHFEAVDWETVVWINGKKIGGHRGGYTPFSFDITDALNPGGEQKIEVRVWDPSDMGRQPRGKQVQNPHGIYYTPVTGIWGSVWIEPVPETYIKRVMLTPDIDNGCVRVGVETEGDTTGMTIAASVPVPGSGKLISDHGVPGETFELHFPAGTGPELWSPQNPALYDIQIQLVRDGYDERETVDSVDSYFGMRKIEVKNDSAGTPRLFLNGSPVFMYGPLDQGFWPDGIYTPPTEEALKFDIDTTLKLGFNMTRKHVKVEPRRWYYWCDRLGLLVWQDMPNGESRPTGDDKEITRSESSANQFEAELKSMIDMLYNHPSIVMWVPFNESWGQFDTARITKWVSEYDPSRLVNSASGWFDLGVGDVKDIHHYPDPAAPEQEPDRASVLGEFGGLGLPVQGHNWEQALASINGSNAGAKNWGYRNLEDTQELFRQYAGMVDALKLLITGKGLSAAVYTQITDVEVEINGLLTYDREVCKFDAGEFAEKNRTLYGLLK